MSKARLYWHIFATEKTATIVTEQLCIIRKQPFPVTAIVTCDPAHEKEWIVVLLLLEDSLVIDSIRKVRPSEYEFDTLKVLYEEAERNEYVGYFHTKGAVKESANTSIWRKLMNYYTIEKAEASVNYLEKEGYDVAGAFRTNGLEGQKPYIAGNFWWAKSNYIRKLPFPKLLPQHTRYDCELWIGLADGSMKTFLETKLLEVLITAIVEKYDTDKKIHGYIPFYEFYLAPFRFKPGKLLEIGVYFGESLKLWQEVFPDFVIEGVDIVEKTIEGAKVHVGDQSDRVFLSSLSDYDIIIDDGGHRSKQQIISLVSKVQNTRLYVIEDLQTSQLELYSDYHEPGEITCLDYLTKYPALKPDYISDAEHEKLAGRKINIEQGRFSPIAFIL